MSHFFSDQSLLIRYYLYRATMSVGFITPIFTLFLLRSLTYTQFAVLSSLYSVLAVVSEVPTGYVSDRLGRRASLLLSVAFTVSSVAGFVITNGFVPYACLYALWALALTFRSGSIDAWLYDILGERSDADQFSRVRGRGDAIQNWTAAISMVGGGLLYGIEPTYPFIAAAVFNSVGFVALLSLPKNSQYAEGGTADRPGPLAAFSVIRDHLVRPSLWSLVVYIGLFYAVVGVAQGYIQPMVIETVAPAVTAFGVDLPQGPTAARTGQAGPTLAFGVGVLSAALTAVAALGGYYAGRIENRFGVRRAVVGVSMITAAMLVVPLWVGVVALPTFAAMRTSMPILKPIANGYINDHTQTVGRATTLSVVSMGYMALRTPLSLGTGVVADATTATTAVAALGVLFLAGGSTVWLFGSVAPKSNRYRN
ncbi:MFS transporter [Halocatena pleomorpha]|uniref:MFS transporter n=1 Tax=Halocatena pleomorpha TaxID=1785090 RepID=A0A3P3RGE6_9EURY|nr:MFS transporter [Halocatena pleomorpha]RRJ31810.1 MFS transporter [Halocatena pleomorpha]